MVMMAWDFFHDDGGTMCWDGRDKNDELGGAERNREGNGDGLMHVSGQNSEEVGGGNRLAQGVESRHLQLAVLNRLLSKKENLIL